jgi:hypothetical protein
MCHSSWGQMLDLMHRNISIAFQRVIVVWYHLSIIVQILPRR